MMARVLVFSPGNSIVVETKVYFWKGFSHIVFILLVPPLLKIEIFQTSKE